MPADPNEMPRLSRWQNNVEAVCRVRLADEGRSLDLRDALVMLNPRHPDHETLMLKVGALLPEDVRDEFVRLRGMSALLAVQETEAVMNQIREQIYRNED